MLASKSCAQLAQRHAVACIQAGRRWCDRCRKPTAGLQNRTRSPGPGSPIEPGSCPPPLDGRIAGNPPLPHDLRAPACTSSTTPSSSRFSVPHVVGAPTTYIAQDWQRMHLRALSICTVPSSSFVRGPTGHTFTPTRGRAPVLALHGQVDTSPRRATTWPPLSARGRCADLSIPIVAHRHVVDRLAGQPCRQAADAPVQIGWTDSRTGSMGGFTRPLRIGCSSASHSFSARVGVHRR